MSATIYAIVPRAEYLQGVDAMGNAYGLCPFCAARVSLRWRGRCIACRDAHGDVTADGQCIDCASTAHRAECTGHVDASTLACEIHISREGPPAVTVDGRHVWEPLDIDAAQRADVLHAACNGRCMGVGPEELAA